MPNAALSLPAPRGMLLDFGGVIIETVKRPSGRAEVVTHLAGLLARAGQPAPADQLRASLDAALTALKAWKNASSRRPEPGELTHREIVGDFLAADLPDAARAVLVGHAHDLMHRWYTVKAEHTLRPGMRELLEFCRDQGMPVVLVSNTVSGRGVRDRLVGHGLESLISGYVFSDKVGRRKPDVAVIREALAMVDLPASACWFLGDQARTDGVAAHIAGIGQRVLTRGGKGSNETLQRALDTGLVTGLIDSPADLIPLLTATLAPSPRTTAYPAPEHTPDTPRTA